MSQKYIVGDGSPFLKRVIIPFYVVRILVMVIEIILRAVSLAYASNNRDRISIGGTRGLEGWVIAVMAIVMVIIAVCLVLDIVCIVKRSRRTLTPLFFLVTNCVQTGVWTALFIITVAGVFGSAIGVIVSIIIYASFLGLLIYASVIYHKHRKGTLRGVYTRGNQNDPTAYEGYSGGQAAKPYNPQPQELDNRYP
ncbi:hypothetical protein CCHL11_09122 [Colletotrichum chlorophyti]|uniref:Uncharacterized protein n=1 Tax=Colletotrichum chlorophyti TaxID=708187 RepID=A0A1Q8RSY2_9PEZI|nr:hypothetical protein CCHL11_09122 [Colletotrichum chlorophyti]